MESNCTESFGLAKIRYNTTLSGSKNVQQYIPQTEAFPINRVWYPEKCLFIILFSNKNCYCQNKKISVDEHNI